jgi:hypothetical protein
MFIIDKHLTETHMKRTVLGIIAVFCLQLAFVGYTVLDSPIETAVAVNEVDGVLPAQAPNISDAEFFAEDTGRSGDEIALINPDRGANERPTAVSQAGYKRAAKQPASRTVDAYQFASVKKVVDIKARTEYPEASRPDLESRTYELSARNRPKKRSFFSKSVSVIKKPYDWLKALGSRVH